MSKTSWTIQAFDKAVDKDHPGMAAAAAWKSAHPMNFMTIDKMVEYLGPDQDAVFSIKLDGELVAISYEAGNAVTVTNKGTVRSGMACTHEAGELIGKKFKSAMFLGELYVVDDAGKPISYMKAASALRDPKKGNDDLIRLSVFDIIKADGKDFAEAGIDEKMAVINDVFGAGKDVRPAITSRGGAEEAKKLWAQLEQKGWEGLVVHHAGEVFKVKPILSYDMVVVAVSKSPKFIDRVGAVLTSFIDKEGKFRLNGYVGGGFTDEERVRFMEWAERNKVWEDEEKIWVDPFKEPIVVEVRAMEVNIKKGPTMEFQNRKWVEVEKDMGGVMRFPQFMRVRDDKEPKYPDVRIEQLPIESTMRVNATKQASYDLFREGMWVRTVSGQMGQIKRASLVHNMDGEVDLRLQVMWGEPLFGFIEYGVLHPTEVSEIWSGPR